MRPSKGGHRDIPASNAKLRILRRLERVAEPQRTLAASFGSRASNNQMTGEQP